MHASGPYYWTSQAPINMKARENSLLGPSRAWKNEPNSYSLACRTFMESWRADSLSGLECLEPPQSRTLLFQPCLVFNLSIICQHDVSSFPWLMLLNAVALPLVRLEYRKEMSLTVANETVSLTFEEVGFQLLLLQYAGQGQFLAGNGSQISRPNPSQHLRNSIKDRSCMQVWC